MKIKIVFMRDFGQGLIWVKEDFGYLEEHDILEDSTVKNINWLTNYFYSCYFEFNTHNRACWIDEDRLSNDKKIWKHFLNLSKIRITELNKKDYDIVDYVSKNIE